MMPEQINDEFSYNYMAYYFTKNVQLCVLTAILITC